MKGAGTKPPFRAGELESPGRHAVARDLRGLAGIFYRKRSDVAAWCESSGLSRAMLVELMTVAGVCAVTRSKLRPFGVGVQRSAIDTARALRVSQRHVHNVRRELQGFVRHSVDLKPVWSLTRRRKPQERRRSFRRVYGGKAVSHRWAHVQGVSYASRRALSFLESHAPKGALKNPDGLWITLWNHLAFVLRRFDIVSAAPSFEFIPTNRCSSASKTAEQILFPSSANRPVEKPEVSAHADEIVWKRRLAGGRTAKSRPNPAPPRERPTGPYGGCLDRAKELLESANYYARRARTSYAEPGDDARALELYNRAAVERYKARPFRRDNGKS